ncbi:MAG TPA: hypothetical protein VD907_00910 [Verrucomicrobiae bacterium]|nr:hypothetical protein [Verrucomicrobiae bacterium]
MSREFTDLTTETAEEVETCFEECLYENFKGRGGDVVVMSPGGEVRFSTMALATRLPEIRIYLAKLPIAFIQGGALPLSEVCLNQHGERWTKDEAIAEKLMLLGMGVKLVRYLDTERYWPRNPQAEPRYIRELNTRLS